MTSSSNPERVTFAPHPVQAVAFDNGWANADKDAAPAQSYLLPDGIVSIQGLITRSGTWVSGELIFRLPESHRPVTGWHVFPVVAFGTHAPYVPATVSVEVDGSCRLRTIAAGPVEYLSLAGIQFTPHGR